MEVEGSVHPLPGSREVRIVVARTPHSFKPIAVIPVPTASITMQENILDPVYRAHCRYCRR